MTRVDPPARRTVRHSPTPEPLWQSAAVAVLGVLFVVSLALLPF